MQDTQSTTHKAKRGRLLPAASPSSYSTVQCTIPSPNNKSSREGESTPRKFKRGLTSAITLTPLPSTIPTTPIRLSTSPQSTDTNPRDGPYPSKIYLKGAELNIFISDKTSQTEMALCAFNYKNFPTRQAPCTL